MDESWLKRLVKWLNGDKKENEVSPTTKIKIFAKRLERQIRKMEYQEKVLKKKAIETRQSGDLTGSKIYMKNSLQYRKWGHATEGFRLKMVGIQYKLEQAKAMESFQGVAQDVAESLQGLSMTVKAPEIQKMLAAVDMGFGNMDAIMAETVDSLDETESASSTGVSDAEVEEALAEIDMIETAESIGALPSSPVGETPENIDELEKEIAKLKAQRGN